MPAASWALICACYTTTSVSLTADAHAEGAIGLHYRFTTKLQMISNAITDMLAPGLSLSSLIYPTWGLYYQCIERLHAQWISHGFA